MAATLILSSIVQQQNDLLWHTTFVLCDYALFKMVSLENFRITKKLGVNTLLLCRWHTYPEQPEESGVEITLQKRPTRQLVKSREGKWISWPWLGTGVEHTWMSVVNAWDTVRTRFCGCHPQDDVCHVFMIYWIRKHSALMKHVFVVWG